MSYATTIETLRTHERAARGTGREDGIGRATLYAEAADALEAQEKRIATARNEALEEAAKVIDEGFNKEVGERFRQDGIPSKNDKCPHGHYMYEECEPCCSAAIRQLKERT